MADHKRLNDENGDYKVPDRIGGLEALEELKQVCFGREWRFIEVDVTFEVSIVPVVGLGCILTRPGVPGAPRESRGPDVSLHDWYVPL